MGLEFLELASGHLGKPIHVTTSTCHSQFSASGGQSDHWTGQGADLGSVANGFPVGGKGGDELAAACGKVLGKSAGEIIGNNWTHYSWKSPSSGRMRRVQVGWKVPDHYDHVHVGVV